MKVNAEAIDKIHLKIKDACRRTPLIRSEALERRLKSKFPIYFKAENLQYTGSFKARGALSKLLSLSESSRKQGIITASAGNHAQGVAYHAQRLGISAKIVMPVATPWVKFNSTKQWGAEIILFGETYHEAYLKAVELQKIDGREYVHSFDDPYVICGQGTIAKEVLEDLPDVEVFVSPIGGGGVIAGCGAYLSERVPGVKIIGVQASGCSTFLPSLKSGAPVTLSQASTIAEGMSVKRMGDIPFEICKGMVHSTSVVDDEEIAEGLLWILENERLFVEGCGGASVAAVLQNPELITGKTVILLSGGNLDVNLLARIIERGLVKAGRLLNLEFTIPDMPGTLHQLTGVFAEERASVVHVKHERVFGQTSLREVQARIILETQGPEHNARLQKKLRDRGWSFRESRF